MLERQNNWTKEVGLATTLQGVNAIQLKKYISNREK